MRSLSRTKERLSDSETQSGTLMVLEVEGGADGKLVISGHDCGNAPLARWGELDYEYWYVLDGSAERQLVEALNRSLGRSRRQRPTAESLLESAFSTGMFVDPSNLRHFMERHEIEHGFLSYV